MAALVLAFSGGSSGAGAGASAGVAVVRPGAVPTGTLPPGLDTCPYHGTPWGWAAKVRPGMARAARKALGADLRAEIHDPTFGTVDLLGGAFRSEAGNKWAPVSQPQARFFTRWRTVLPQSQQRALHSCDFMLGDRPAAQHLAQVADAAVRAHHLYTPSAKVHVYEQEVSDNPWAPGSVIVTLHVDSGRSVDRFHDGGPPEEIDEPFTVVVKQSTAQPTSVTRGGL